MDITLNNFKDTLPKVLDAIDSCDFLAIDTEFTGLRNGTEVTAYDTPALYYSKLRNGSLNFLLIQVGICTFKYDKVKKKYVYNAYNFYVFPRQVGRHNNDSNFLCQASSISFLTSAGFDFNKVFKEGIPYLNVTDEESLLEELQFKYDNLNQDETSFSKVTIPDELMPTVEEACSKIEEFLSPDNSEKEITFDRCNGFIRKLIFQTAYERFSTANFSLLTRLVGNNIILVAQKGKSKADQDKENFEKDKFEINEAVGFSKIIRHISRSKKLIVGHNMLLDICHIVNRFYWSLPENYYEFKDMVHQLFPRICDTKYICSAYPFNDLIQSSVVNHMIKRLKEPPFHFAEAESENSDFGYSIESGKAHEAAFDAYTTGLAFISLTSYLGKNKKSAPVDMELLKPYENKLFLMRIMDYSHINLIGKEPKPSRKNVFHLTFPKEWKTADINKLFNPFAKNIHVSYCNHTSAWVTLLKETESDAVISNLIVANRDEFPLLKKPYTLLSWSQYANEIKPPITVKSHVEDSRASHSAKKMISDPENVPSSSMVCESSGDADSCESEFKSPIKRSHTAANNIPRKRKKRVQDRTVAENLKSDENMEGHSQNVTSKCKCGVASSIAVSPRIFALCLGFTALSVLTLMRKSI